jgi:hypothetical protein
MGEPAPGILSADLTDIRSGSGGVNTLSTGSDVSELPVLGEAALSRRGGGGGGGGTPAGFGGGGTLAPLAVAGDTPVEGDENCCGCDCDSSGVGIGCGVSGVGGITCPLIVLLTRSGGSAGEVVGVTDVGVTNGGGGGGGTGAEGVLGSTRTTAGGVGAGGAAGFAGAAVALFGGGAAVLPPHPIFSYQLQFSISSSFHFPYR